MNNLTDREVWETSAEQLIKIYLLNVEELELVCAFGNLYTIACECDEAAAKALEMDCEAAMIHLSP